jgi:hypothetical protein
MVYGNANGIEGMTLYNMKKIIVESRWKGDTKWSYRAELVGSTETKALLQYYKLVAQDERLRCKNEYRVRLVE